MDSSGSSPGVRPKGRGWPQHILGETRAEPIRMCRKRSFATDGRKRLQARAAVCRIPCLILCLADVERVGQCRATHREVELRRRLAARQRTTTARVDNLEVGGNALLLARIKPPSHGEHARAHADQCEHHVVTEHPRCDRERRAQDKGRP